MTRPLLRSLCLLFLTASIYISSLQASDTSTAWQDVELGKNVVILRHATAPGNGDPSHFDISNCDTQRNLSNEGHQQAKRIGELLSGFGIKDAQVYTSQWCRCADTASALALGTPKELPELNSFYSNPTDGPAQIDKLKRWLGNLNPSGPVVLVTHQVVITALTGVYPASGETVVFNIDNQNNINVVLSVETK